VTNASGWYDDGVIVLMLVLSAGCGRGPHPGPFASATVPGSPLSEVIDAAAEPMDDRERAAWARAESGDEGDRSRLADLVGCEGLRERATDPAFRRTAIRSMAYCAEFSQLPFLVGVSSALSDDEAADALESVVEQASSPRRSNESDDAEELRIGCRALLALSLTPAASRRRRVVAVRALRMLAERGCVTPAEIPSEFDTKQK